MLHEVGPSLTTAGRRRKHPCIKQCLNTQGQVGENKWRTISWNTSKCRIRAECVQYACRKTSNVWMQTTLTTHLKALIWTLAATKVCPRTVLLWELSGAAAKASYSFLHRLMTTVEHRSHASLSTIHVLEDTPSFRITIFMTTVKTSE